VDCGPFRAKINRRDHCTICQATLKDSRRQLKPISRDKHTNKQTKATENSTYTSWLLTERDNDLQQIAWAWQHHTQAGLLLCSSHKVGLNYRKHTHIHANINTRARIDLHKTEQFRYIEQINEFLNLSIFAKIRGSLSAERSRPVTECTIRNTA